MPVSIMYQAAEELDNTPVKINGLEFLGVRICTMEAKNEELEHSTEENFVVADHVRREPVKLKMSMAVYDIWLHRDEMMFDRAYHYLKLKDWADKRLLCTVVSDLGVFDNMLITSLKVRESPNSKSSFDVNMDMKEIIVAYLQPIEEQWYYDVDGEVYESNTYENAVTDGTLSKPKENENTWHGWRFGYNIAEIHDWIVGGDAEFKWPWE